MEITTTFTRNTLLLTILLILGFVIYFNLNIQKSMYKIQAAEPTNILVKSSVFKEYLGPLKTPPKRLQVPDQNIDLKVIPLGITASGALETPKNWFEAGWFERGAKPGEEGNVIINAHYDTNTGAPAGFFKLKNISVNDNVDLIDEIGNTYTYKVSEVFYLDIQDPTRLSVFETNEDSFELTLITCGGVWLPQEGTYNKRLVVKAKFIDVFTGN